MSVITYKRGDKTALMKNFSRYEFDCPCGFKSTTSLEGGFLHESHRISGQRHISPEQKFHP